MSASTGSWSGREGFDEDVSPLYQVRLTVNDYFSVLLHLHFFLFTPH